MISTKQLGALLGAFLGWAVQVQAGIPMTLGTTYSGALSLPGETHTYTFAGLPGQRLYYDSQDADALNMYASVVSPTGAQLFQQNDDYDYGPFVLTEGGTYSLVVNGSGATTGSYKFRLLDLAAAPAMTLGTTLSGQLSPVLACNIYQFNGTRGQRVNLQTLGFSSNYAQWQLVSPANVVLVSGQIYQSLGVVTLPQNGPYTLMVMGYSYGTPPTTPFTFQVLVSDVSDTPVSTTGFGTPHAGTVFANQTNSFTYTAPAGLPVYFDSLDASGQSLVVDLVDPAGKAVFTVGETADSGPYTLPRSGTYTINVRGPGGASGNFNFRLLDLTASPALPLNTPSTNSLSLAYQTDIYQYSGTAGQHLFYNALNNTYPSITVRLLGPDGQNPLYGNVSYNLGPSTLPYSSVYYFIVQSSLSSSSSYQFELFDAAAQPALPLNTPLTGALAANTALLYQLAGTTGEQLFFNGEGSGSYGASWTLYDPKNAAVPGGSSSLAGDFELTLPYTGNYLLVIANGGSAVTYSNVVNTFGYQTNALALGSPVTNNIANPGGQFVYTFTETAGHRLYYDALTSAYLATYVTLLSPNGVTVFYGNAYYDIGPVTLTESGTYSLIVDGGGDTTGPLSFQLLDVGAQPALPLNVDITGTVAPNASTIFQLAGTSGEQLYFNGKAPYVGSAYWTLYDPKNTTVGSANFGGDFSATLPYTGNYTLVFANTASSPSSYSNQVNTFTFTTNALTLGQIVSNNIVEPGNQVFYTFTGTAGQRVFYDSLFPAGQSMYMSLFSPSGLNVFSGNPSYDLGPYTLPQSGTYTLQFSAYGHTTGPLNFQLLDIGAQPALPLNTDLTGILQSNTAQIYQLAGTTGEHLYFGGKGVSAGGAYWTLYGPNNASITGTALSYDFEVTLPNNGTYALVMAGATTSVSYTNQVNTFAYATNALTLGTAVTSAILKPGNQLYYTFTGTAGQRLYYDSRMTNYLSVYAVLYSPSGASLNIGIAYYDKGPFTLTQSGTYTLVFDGQGNTTGTVSFNLLDLSAATPITLGTTVSGSLSDQTETRLFKFSGTAGQRVNLQSSTSSSTLAYWTLLGTADQILGPQPYISGNIGIITLPASGTYVVGVVGYGQNVTPVAYQWSAADVSDGASSTTGFGTVNSGTIGANQTNTFTYNAPAGLPVFFDSQDTSGQNLAVDLVSPDGTTVFSVGETADSGPYILPRSGAYTLSVRGYNGASGNYSFRLLNLTTAAVLPLNTPVSNLLTNPYQTDVYQFTSYAGQKLYYNGLTNDVSYPSVIAQLLDPRGQVPGPNGDFANNYGPFLIQNAGSCYVFMRNYRNVASFCSFQVLDVNTQPTLPLNVGVTNTLGTYAAQAYQYSGSAGQTLYFRGLQGNPGGSWYLYDPNNAAVSGAGNSLAGDFEVTLPFSGTYLLMILNSSGSPGTEVFQVNDFNYFTNNYTIGTTVLDTLARPGERRIYTFTGTIGQQLYYDGLTNDPPYPNVITVQMLNPQGLPEGPVSGRFSYDIGPFTLKQSGTYTLVIDGNSSSVGTYAFRLLDVAAQPALPLNTSVTNIVDVYPALIYRYAGNAGQPLYFRGQSGNPSGFWTLYDPNNNVVPSGSSSLAGDFEVALPLSGTYALVLGSYATAAGPSVFQVNDFAYFTNSYTLGTVVNGSINRPGERRYYTFAGTVGQRLVYDALTNDPPAPNALYATLYNPQGVQEGPIGGGRFSYDAGPFALQQSGTYTLAIDGGSASVGPFAFRLLDVASQPALPLNVSVTNSLGLYPLIVYQYSGTNGEQMYFRGNASNPSGYWTLYDPNNAAVSYGSASLAGDFEVTLPKSGNYTLLQGSYGTSSGTTIFAVNPFNFGETPLVNRAPVLSPIPAQTTGEGANLSFTAVATDPDNNALTFSLDPGGPGGATINASTGVFSWTPPSTGFSYQTNVVVRVTDNGIPNLSAAQTVTINIVAGPVMLTVQKTGGSATVYWRTAIGKHYQLQYKNSLGDASWTSIGSVLAATAYVTSEVDGTLGNSGSRFYRVQLLDP